MNEKERIEELLHHFRMEQKDFAKKCGFRPQVVSDIKFGKCGFSRTIYDKIIKAFPEVNKEWLSTGEGEMLNADLSVTKLAADAKTRHLIPFYDDARTIGGINGRTANVNDAQYPTEFIDTGDWFRDATEAMRHYGDSMIEYPPGCILAMKEVQDFRLIVPGKDYVIETNEYRVTKKVRLKEDGLRAYSTNEEKYDDGELIHQPFNIPFVLIRRIYEVLGYVVKKGSGTIVHSNK